MAKLTSSWYHSHVGVGLLTAHGALIVHQKGEASFDTNCPIHYDEERVFIVGDLYNKKDVDLVKTAANGAFIGGANVSPSRLL
jgi:FtsP/CotA-like multicopper oxidase with cupredoxin domain